MVTPIRGKEKVPFSEIQLDRDSKKILKKLKSENPQKIASNEISSLLAQYGLIEYFSDTNDNIYIISLYGKQYKEYLNDRKKIFVMNSVIVPIFVAFVTALSTCLVNELMTK